MVPAFTSSQPAQNPLSQRLLITLRWKAKSRELKTRWLSLTDQEEVLIAKTSAVPSATITNNPNLVLISRQFIWMEFFTQRIYSQIGDDLLGETEPG